MSLSKRISSRSLARGIASRKRIADSWLSFISFFMLPETSRSIPRLSASVSRSAGSAVGHEQQDFLWPAVLAHAELLGAQVRDQPALGVAGGHGDVDDLQSGAEHRLRARRGARWRPPRRGPSQMRLP